MVEHLGMIGVLSVLSTLLAEQLFGGWVHKNWMRLLALATSIGVTYAAWFVGAVETLGLDFAELRVMPLQAVWAYGVFVFIAAHYDRKALKAVLPGVADPSIKVGDVIGKVLPSPKPPESPPGGPPSVAALDALITEARAKGWTDDQIRAEGKKRGISVA